MPEQPKRTWRRFFQYRLSTWLVLVAIVAWEMSLGPHLRVGDGAEPPLFEIGGVGDRHACMFTFGFYCDLVSSWEFHDLWITIAPIPGVLYPVLALFAFLVWKGFWIIRERRRPTQCNNTIV